MSIMWNPWHGCHKVSEGCKNCYVYRQDYYYEKNSSKVTKNSMYDLPIRCNKNGEYKIHPGETVNTCFTSDFLLEDADKWRPEVWRMIKKRSDLDFFFITKRPERFFVGLPDDWGNGYENVTVACTVENQRMADYRLPTFLHLPIKHKSIAVSPLLEMTDLTRYLGPAVKMVAVGGESGANARICDFKWVLDIRSQCIENKVSFCYHQTGSKLLKDGKIYNIPRKFHHSQARLSGIDFEI